MFTSTVTDTAASSNEVASGASITLISSGPHRTHQRITEESGASFAEGEAVVSLTRTHNHFPIALQLGRVVCCLTVRLKLTPCFQSTVVTVYIEPSLRVNNRSRQKLFCKPVVTPVLSVQPTLPMVGVLEISTSPLILTFLAICFFELFL